jgi:DNA-directed RNA polymerase specialized sigma24 family protein
LRGLVCVVLAVALQLPRYPRALRPDEVPMTSSGSVTAWIDQLKAGARSAAQPLWENYFGQLVARARQKLAGLPRRAADEEDVVLSAFDSFFRAAERGRFPQLNDRHDLWQLLIVITDRKVYDMVQFERRQRRGGGRVLDEAALRPTDSERGHGLSAVIGQEPSPEFAALLAEECRLLLARLDDPELQRIAQRKMEGYTVEEIAAELGCVSRTVKRRLHMIRRIWEEESGT